MNSYLFFYLVSLVDRVHALMIFAAIVSLMITIAVIVLGLDFYDDDNSIMRKWFAFLKYAIPFMVILFLAIPSRNDLLLIAAGGTIVEYTKGDTSLQKIPHEITDWVRKEIQKVKEENKGE